MIKEPSDINKKDFNKSLVSLRAFVEDPDVLEIIHLCRMVPVSTWKIWRDDSGNTLGVFAPDTIRTTREAKPVYSDLWLRAKPQQILAKSTYIQVGWNQDKSIVYFWFLGIDARARMLVCQNGNYSHSLSPIISGIDALLVFVKNKNLTQITKLGKLKVLAPIKTELEIWGVPVNLINSGLPKPLSSILKLLSHETKPISLYPKV